MRILHFFPQVFPFTNGCKKVYRPSAQSVLLLSHKDPYLRRQEWFPELCKVLIQDGEGRGYNRNDKEKHIFELVRISLICFGEGDCMSELIEKAKENARQNFRDGLNCAESVLKAIIDTGVIDFPPEIVAMATGFGGGMGLAGNNCGALVGAIMAVGAVHGRRNPLEGEFQERVDRLYGNPGLYRFFNGMSHEFKSKFKALDCKILNEGYSDWMDKNRFKQCMKMVIDAAGMAMEYIEKGKTEGYTQPFGENVAGKA